MGELLDQLEEGASLFEGITAAAALNTLRVVLAALGVEEAKAYRTHDLRRGHCRDLQQSGAEPQFCCHCTW